MELAANLDGGHAGDLGKCSISGFFPGEKESGALEPLALGEPALEEIGVDRHAATIPEASLIFQYDRCARRLLLAPSRGEHPAGFLPVRLVLRGHGGRYHEETSTWQFPADRERMVTLADELRQRGCYVDYDANVRVWSTGLDAIRKWTARLRAGEAVNGLPIGYHVPPYGFQRTGATWLAFQGGAGLCDETGLGKTKQAIDAARARQGHAVVVCPNSVKWNWKAEVLKNDPAVAGVVIPAGSTRRRAETIREWTADPRGRWLVLNYESLRYFETEFLQAVAGRTLILDEAHRAKNPRAQVTRILLSARPEYLWLLTGTPNANRPEDVWSLCQLIEPGCLGWSWYGFEREHIVRNKVGMIVGYKNLERVRTVFGRLWLGRKKADCLDLPAKVFETRLVELSSEERRAYESMRKDLKAWLESEVPIGGRLTTAQAATFGARLIRLRQIADGFVSEGVDGRQAWSAARTKIKEAVAVWEDAGRPRMVVWAQYVPVIRMLHDEFENAAAEVAAIWGDVPIETQETMIRGYNELEGTVLIGQMDVMGEGLNLQAGALQVFVDVPWTPKQRIQCIDRLHRIGQTRSVTIVDILARGTVDQYVMHALEGKMALGEWVTSESKVQGTREEAMRLVEDPVRTGY